MRNFAIGLLVLNLLYLSWNLGLLPGSGKQEESFVRSPRQQAPASLVLLKELTDQQLRENTLTVSETTDTGSLSETASAQITEISTQDSNADGFAGEGIVAGAVNSCLAFGVFDNIASSNALVTQLRQQGFQARVELQEQTDSEYRVYMPPFTSDTAARQTLANLLEHGVDSFLITDGDLARGISLGVFSQQNSAYRLQEELAAEGYATNIQEIVRSNTEFWVVVQSLTAASLEALWQALLIDQPGLKQSENLCEIVAPEA